MCLLCSSWAVFALSRAKHVQYSTDSGFRLPLSKRPIQLFTGRSWYSSAGAALPRWTSRECWVLARPLAAKKVAANACRRQVVQQTSGGNETTTLHGGKTRDDVHARAICDGPYTHVAHGTPRDLSHGNAGSCPPSTPNRFSAGAMKLSTRWSFSCHLPLGRFSHESA